MLRRARLLLPLLLLPALSGCLTDPFGTKPEVPNVKIPERTAPAEPEAAPAKEDPAP
ncbi:MAG: hypothetical protein IPK75_05980 [Acidobacteria bacterium]|jgi:hypothetical protein|nr:hypothetical protein [Acidobacteriota bacterium]